MAQSFTSDELQALATYPFNDTDWKNKFLIGSLIAFAQFIIPIIPGLILYGYCAQIMRRIIVEDGEPFLPEWDDFGKFLMDGLKLFGASLIYSLPLILLFLTGYVFMFASIFTVPFFAATAEATGEPPSPLIGLLPMLGTFAFMGVFGVGMILSLVWGAILPAMLGHIVVTDEFAAAFRWQEWWPIFRANLGGFILSYVLVIGFWIILSFAFQILYITIIGCCFVPFILPPLTMYTLVVATPLFGRAYRDGVQQLKTPEEPVP